MAIVNDPIRSWFRNVVPDGCGSPPLASTTAGVFMAASAMGLFSWKWPWSRRATTVKSVTDAIRLALTHARHGNMPGTFLAYGTDEGGILLAVSNEPFDRIVGLETDALVAARVTRNVRRQASHETAQRIEVVCEAAATFDVPDSVTTVFVWNVGVSLPLDDILRQVGQSLQHRPRSLWIIYAAPADANIAALMTCPWVNDVTPIPMFEHEEIRVLVLEHFHPGTLACVIDNREIASGNTSSVAVERIGDRTASNGTENAS